MAPGMGRRILLLIWEEEGYNENGSGII